MSDQNRDQSPDPTTPAGDPTSEPTAAEGTQQPVPEPGRLTRWRTGLRERAGRTRKGVVLAVAGALLVGGAGGFAAGALATDGHHDGGRGQHSGRLDEGRQGPPPGVPGQLPPATRDDDSGLDG